MSPSEFPSRQHTTICFAHIAYQMQATFENRATGVSHFQVWTPADLTARIGEADVVVISGFWHNGLLENAHKLKYIQSIGAGYDQFDQAALRQRGIRLANARGVNKNAVSEHTMATILAFTRHIHSGRDHQHSKQWRGMLSDLTKREDELGGKTLLIFGMGDIGSRVAKLAKAFDMHVIGVKRNLATAAGPADELHAPDKLLELLPRADFVVLNCPLTPETANLINTETLAAMHPGAYLINMARGGCVDEDALLAALRTGQIAGAGLDTLKEEPLGADSPFWELENVIITPHTAGETRKYEENVLDILLENLERLWAGKSELRNQIV
ncbi:MAG: D-2-hydroxyacid dehydrogenase [Caldilineaceae bacterium]